jgi:hypothetical protein
MLMEGFSANLNAVPLILPYVADLGNRHINETMSPFQLAMIFLLNLELAYCMPPLGLNLFISSFRFNRPVSSLYKVVLPFVGILAIGLFLVSYVPFLSNVAVAANLVAAREKSKKDGLPPREAWMLECVQVDPSSPQPCSRADREKYPGGQLAVAAAAAGSDAPEEGVPADKGLADKDPADKDPALLPEADAGCNPDFRDCTAEHNSLTITFKYDGDLTGTLATVLYSTPAFDDKAIVGYQRARGVTKFPNTYKMKNVRSGKIYAWGFLDVCDNSLAPHKFDPQGSALVPVEVPENGAATVTLSLVKNPYFAVACEGENKTQ